MRTLFLVSLLLGVALASLPLDLHCTGECQMEDPNSVMTIKKLMEVKMKEREECHLLGLCPAPGLKGLAETPCENGKAGEYPCNNVDLLSFTPLAALGTQGEANDIWGWNDLVNNREIAIVGLTDGTSFVDVTEPSTPVVLGFLPSSQPGQVIWRDIKVYQHYAYIVSEHRDHGMQVYDMSKLPSVAEAKKDASPRILKEDAHYKEFGSCHNVVINEESGFAYGVGSKTCKGGLHMVDIRTPLAPKFAGCYSDDGYCHDAQCVNYKGPDSRYHGHEICFSYNEDSLTLTDVTDKANPVLVSRVAYEGYAYTHQGWLTENQHFLLLDDELDEVENKNDGHTQTYVWDVVDLTQPRLIGSFHSPATAIDHNQYILGDLSYQANYEAGLRILNISSIASGKLTEFGYFDVRPETTAVQFFGSWSVYPYLKSGNIIVTGIERGFFVVRPNFASAAKQHEKKQE